MMQGSLRVSGRPALINLRISVDNVPADGEVDVADVMLQPGGSASGWMPHVTEMPWSAGVTPDEETSTVYSRLNALESEVSTIRDDIEPITVAGDIWRGESVSWDSRISAEWHPEHGWISWVDLAGLVADGVSGDLLFTFAAAESASVDRPARWGVQILTETASGVSALSGRLGVTGSATSLGEDSLDVWPTWESRVQQDVTIPAGEQAQPQVVIEGVGSSSTGRVGLVNPWVGAAAAPPAVDQQARDMATAAQTTADDAATHSQTLDDLLGQSTGARDITALLEGGDPWHSTSNVSIERRGQVVIFAMHAIRFDTSELGSNWGNWIPDGFRPSADLSTNFGVDNGSEIPVQISVYPYGNMRIRGDTGGSVAGHMVWFTDQPWPSTLPGDPA